MVMAVILRIDVDDSYPNRILHYARVNQGFFPGIDSLGYSEMTKKIVHDLNDRGIRASLFFQPHTIPNKNFAEDLVKHGHSVGLHAVHTNNYDNFFNEFNKITNRFNGYIHGFTKHGSGKAKLSRKHDPTYNSDILLRYAKKLQMKYFLGNGENPDLNLELINGVLYFPSAFWINRNYREDKYSVEWLIDTSAERDIVVLMHPEDIVRGTALVVREYENILDMVDIMTIDEKISSFQKF